MVDLWIMQSRRYVDIALEEGIRQFTVQTGSMLKARDEELSWMRANTAAYGPVKVMIMDHAGAAEYSTFGNYTKPLAVYPTWAAQDEPWETLVWLLENPVGQNEVFCNDPNILPEHRPVWGQKHRVVVHYLPKPGNERQLLMLKLRQLQIDYPDAEVFVSGAKRFNDLFGIGFKAVDFWPEAVALNGALSWQITLPTGKILNKDRIWDKRYQDWFRLIGFEQTDVVLPEDMIRFCIRAGVWGQKNFSSIKPFVSPTTKGGGNNTVFMEAELITTPDSHFILPAARRRMLRNIGMQSTEADKFTCDSCILQNACTLYREGSVCTLKGSEAVALADAFGSRSVDVLIGGLSQLLKKNAERLDDAIAEEENAADGLDPEVTKLSKTVFEQGTKLVKLIDPSLAGGPKVQVNVGVGAGGNAQINTGSDPKQLMATIVAQLEESGIPRGDIDGDMVKGVLRNMAQVGQQQAISTAAVQHQIATTPKVQPKTIEGGTA
jgi:hypothetical protein